ncbi:MAG: LPXTG cell wall anchor domain-containing protein, partial [Oscillospiraceae bacterium]|nr:LPXTG cell wall anchor domain-containing protein [Oscillospiraceae bacterium]
WIVNVPEGTETSGCSATIKIPGFGWGTDTSNKEERHLTLVQGDNLVYEFTPQETGDFLFTCWMGSGCHSNYIHVTAGGIPDSNAIKGINGHTESAHTEQSTSTISGTTATTAKVTATASRTAAAASAGAAGPKTGEHSLAGMIALLFSFLGIVFVTGKRRKKT